MLAKGILGLMLPGLVLTLWLGARRKWMQIVLLAPLSLVSLAMFVPWVVGTAQSMGWENILQEFYSQNFGRFASGSRGHDQPFWYYFKNFWIDLWPWAILFPWAVIWTVKTRLWRDPKVQLLLWWFGTFLIFLTLAETKRQLYMLPAFPAIVLILGRWLAVVGRTDDEVPADLISSDERPVQIATIFIVIVFAVAGIGCILFAVFFDSIIAGRNLGELQAEVAIALRFPMALLGLAMLSGAVWTGFAVFRHQPRSALMRTGLSQIVIWAVALAFAAPALQPIKTFGPQSRWVKQQIGPEQTHIGMVYPGLGERKRGGFAYEMGGTMVELLDDRIQVDQFFALYPDSVVLVNEISMDAVFAGDEPAWQSRTLRMLLVGSTSFAVVRGPANQ